MKPQLPKWAAAGAAADKRRRAGLPPPAATLQSVQRQLVPVRPVLPAPAARGVPPGFAHRPPLLAPSRLTALKAIQTQRDKSRARQISAGPKEAARLAKRDKATARIAAKAATVRMIRMNPPSPLGDLKTGRLRYTGAFSKQPFSTPFQKSVNIRRSYGA